MIIRIVKMSFYPDRIPDFLEIFEASRERIRSFKGCEHLELLQDRDRPHLIFTYSYWTDQDSLNAYRNSDLFRQTWAKTKALFNDKPEAWSLECLSRV